MKLDEAQAGLVERILNEIDPRGFPQGRGADGIPYSSDEVLIVSRNPS